MPYYKLSEKVEKKISKLRYYSCTVAGDEIPMFVHQIKKIKATCFIIKDNCDYCIDSETVIYDPANGNMVVAFLFNTVSDDAKFMLTSEYTNGQYTVLYSGYEGIKYTANITLNNKQTPYSVTDNTMFANLCKAVKY